MIYALLLVIQQTCLAGNWSGPQQQQRGNTGAWWAVVTPLLTTWHMMAAANRQSFLLLTVNSVNKVPSDWKGGITLRVHLTPERPRNLIFSQFECKWMRLGISWKKSIFLLSGSPTIMHYMGCVKWSNPGFSGWVSAAHQTQNIEYSHRNTAWTEWW